MHNMRILIGCILMLSIHAVAAGSILRAGVLHRAVQDTLSEATGQQDSLAQDSLTLDAATTAVSAPERDSIFSDQAIFTVALDADKIARFPAATLQQYMKDQAPGLSVQENSGEPGWVDRRSVVRG